MSCAHVANQGFLTSPFLTGANHDGGSVGIISTNVDAAVATQFLKPDPNVSLDVFHQMTDVNRAVGIRKSTGDEYFACHE